MTPPFLPGPPHLITIYLLFYYIPIFLILPPDSGTFVMILLIEVHFTQKKTAYDGFSVSTALLRMLFP